ncbi:MAG: glycosyltransferase, partial [Actinobacteria bacterium]|nr:glycosyltransferase [Actinomycetota bacterium]
MDKDIAVIIPSYNEEKNIKLLVKKITSNLRNAKIFIVDDSSFEENQKLKKILRGRKNITLISRLRKLGRGTAVLRGLKEAVKDKSIKYFFEMDSDHAHDPYEMHRFIKKIKKDDYDLVIGSRYIPGGKVINVSSIRIILSKLINVFLKLWLGVKVSDYTGGFRLYNRKVVNFLLVSGLKSKGFITLSEILFKLYRNGYKIGEVPISVYIRVHGKSNVNTKELYESLLFVLGMRLKAFKKSHIVYFSLAVFIIFISFWIRISTLNQMGRGADEQEYVEQGYKMDQLIRKMDFNNSYFYTTYDHPPMVKYIYGLTAPLDINHL